MVPLGDVKLPGHRYLMRHTHFDTCTTEYYIR
jgi:hypothetical protein